MTITPLTSMHRLSLLSAKFENTVNNVLGHDNFRKIAIFKIFAVKRSGENNAYPCQNNGKKRGLVALRSRSFMNEGQCQSGQLEGISLSIIMSKYEVNPLTNKKVIQKIAKIEVFDLECQSHLWMKVKVSLLNLKAFS